MRPICTSRPAGCARLASRRYRWLKLSVLPWLAALPAMAAAQDARQVAETVCATCHGEGGNSVVAVFPKLAGQQQTYIAKQLNDFLAGKRKNEVMAPTIATLKPDDVPALAAYFAGKKPVKGTPGDARLAEAGKRIFEDGNTDSGVPACLGCHRAEGDGNERYPALAGQHREYLLQQIADFKSGARTNDKGKVMRAVAQRLSDEEARAVAEYIAGM